MVLVLAADKDWEQKHWDIKQAFIQADISEDIFVHLCDGCGTWSAKIVLLAKALCGTKQASREFNNLFFGTVWIKEQFSIEDCGDIDHSMGSVISRDRIAQTVTISQNRYIKSICQGFGMDGAKKRAVPHNPSRTLDKSDHHPSVDENTPYREAFGCLVWAPVMTRVDIANAVHEVAKYSSNPKVTHWRAVKCIFVYLNTCPSVGLSFGGFDTECELSAYADASYAGDWNDRRSVTGGAIMFAGGTMSWMSKVQRVIALSSTESEYIALCNVAQELLLLRSVVEFIQLQ
ncbi:unnamed protein product [Choristocarpus tenellus]